jgi:hypothetical protein
MKRANKERNVAVLPDGEGAGIATDGEGAAVATETKGKGEIQSRKQGKQKSKEDDLSFWDFAAGLGDRWLSGDLKIYCYRIWPRIDTQQERVYISIVQEPIDEEYLLRHFGSGRYLLMLKDRSKLLRKHTVSVHNPAYPPKVHESEVLDHPANDAFFKAWGTKKPDSTAGKSDKQPSVQTDVNTVLTTVLEKTGSFDPKLAELWERTAKERDEMSKKLAEKNAPPDLLSVAKGLKDLFPTQPVASEPATQMDMATLLRLAKELQPPPAPNPLELLETAKGLFSPPADDLANIDRLLGIADKLASLRGGGGGGRGSQSGWNLGLDYVRELAPLVPYFGSFFGLRVPGTGAAPAPGAAGTAAASPQPTAFDPYQRPDLARQHAQSLNGFAAAQAAAAASPGAAAAPPPVASASINGTASAAASPNDLLATFQMYGGLVVQALNSGVPGYDFADHITALTGNVTHAMIAAHGEDALVRTMMSIPEIALFGEPRLRTFTKEFLNYEAYLSEEEESGAESANEDRQRKRGHAAGFPSQ